MANPIYNPLKPENYANDLTNYYNPSSSMYDSLKNYKQNNIEPIPMDYKEVPKFSSTTSTVDSGLKPGMNEAQVTGTQQAISAGVGGIADIGMGLLQTADNNKLRAEAKQVAQQNRNDRLVQENTDIDLKKRIQEQEDRAFTMQKKKESNDLRYNKFLYSIKQAIENENGIREQTAKMFNPEMVIALQQFMKNRRSQ